MENRRNHRIRCNVLYIYFLLIHPLASAAVSWDSPWSTTNTKRPTSRARIVPPPEHDLCDDIVDDHESDPFDPSARINLESLPRRKKESLLQLAWDETEPASPFTSNSGLEQSTSSGREKRMEDNFLSTGTTIVGVSGRDFCVLAADTRATAGRIVADRRAAKLHPLAANCAAAGAGTSADLEHVTRQALYSSRLQALMAATGNANVDYDTQGGSVSVTRLCRSLQDVLYQQGGACQANLIVGGVFEGQSILRALHPHGSMDRVVYTALGSGGLAAMSVLESRYRTDMTVEEARELSIQAITAGIKNDLGSGSQVDVCVIGPDGVAQYTRCAVPEEELPEHKAAKAMLLSENDDGGRSSPGVNGFGNVPYRIQSKRVIRVNRELQEEERFKVWKDLLSSST